MSTQTEEGATGKSGNAEAQRYRQRLRAVEQERDALAARVAAFTRAEIERQVSDRLEDPDDLFVIGQTDVTDFVDDEGNVDTAKVDEAVEVLLERRPRLARGWEPDADGLDGGARQSVTRAGASWSSVLSGAER